MKLGFIIDNRKCIGCHACTTACKAEHDVPVGVFRTWVKQVEKGIFPHTRRLFSVMRCNHCTDAPCVEICPVEALYFRPDGIVDFDNQRCIACKSCMQACPYDALYIDPETQTAAKCNYCAHRVDVGLEPACVNVCPEHAIISGDMDDPNSEISTLLSREQVSARKTAKGTKPNLFYIDGDESSLNPTAVPRSSSGAYAAQAAGVGHFSGKSSSLAFDGDNLLSTLMEKNGSATNSDELTKKSIALLMGQETKRFYDAPDKGLLWGREVWTYVWTKAIAAGAFLVPFLGMLFGYSISPEVWLASSALAMVFLVLTTFFLVSDLDQPMRFLYVILRPQTKSWLVRGGYALTLFGGFLTAMLAQYWIDFGIFTQPLLWLTAIAATVTAVYTAFLFAQAKGRDFWQSPMLAFHMIGHSIAAGSAALLLVGMFVDMPMELTEFLTRMLIGGLLFNGAVMLFELSTTHPTDDAKTTVNMILHGRYRTAFWLGSVLLGIVLPLALLWFGSTPLFGTLAALAALAGILVTEKIWVEAPQRIALS